MEDVAENSLNMRRQRPHRRAGKGGEGCMLVVVGEEGVRKEADERRTMRGVRASRVRGDPVEDSERWLETNAYREKGCS